MNRSLFVIYATVVLDAIGIGLIFPILPALLKDITHSSNIVWYIGILASVYAAMQFLFSPIIGALSDRIGRRPVLLFSLAGATVNYLFLAFSQNLLFLIIGRVIAGISNANIAVLTAYLVDVSPEHKRAKYFGLMSAMFGGGFIIGPVLGGLLSDYWIRLPFLVAAVLTGLNYLLSLFILPESLKKDDTIQKKTILNPFKLFLSVRDMQGVIPLIFIFFILNTTGQAYGVCWPLWGHDTFNWDGFWIGMSLGMFGLCHMFVQALIPGYASKKFGHRKTILLALAFGSVGLLIMAFAQQGWLVFLAMPIFALGNAGGPSLQTIASQKVPAAQQGQFQGVVASTISLSSMISPLLFSTFYAHLEHIWPGAVWLTIIVLYGITLPFIFHSVPAKNSEVSV